MADISVELLESMRKDFLERTKDHKRLATITEKIRNGTATYREANQYAITVGEILAQVFQANLSSQVLPNGKLYYNIAKKVVDPLMVNNFLLISKISKDVQTALNKQAGLGIIGIEPKLNQDRIDGILQRLVNEDTFDDVKWLLDEPVVNFSQSIVDDTIRANAQFHLDAGLSPKIIRTANAGCCEWCSEVVGTYDYYKVSNTGNNVFRRHRHCRCEVDYVPGDGRKQNAHTKAWR